MSQSIVTDKVQNKINKAKSKARPELITNENKDEWTSLDFCNKFDANPDSIIPLDRQERIDVNKTSIDEFRDKFEKTYRPVVLINVVNSWPASQKWTLEYFLKRYKNEKFKCGEDDYGYNVKLKFKYFYQYMKTNRDDSPLYIFDANLEDGNKKRLLRDYSLPSYFDEDLFQYVGERRRPPYRWLVIGSPRSGTGIHIDPLGTSAWNALIVGYKRWCLFPTKTPRNYLKLNSSNYVGKQNHEAIEWFDKIYPLVKSPSWPEEYKPIEIVQGPGETVFVPSGWWHVVVNLTDTIAVTQNFVSSVNFPVVWHKTAGSRSKLSKYWGSQLMIHRPDLFNLAQKIDLNSPIDVNSDSSSGISDSSSSSSGSSCSCCSHSSSDSDDSGKASSSLPNKQKKRKYSSSDESVDGERNESRKQHHDTTGNDIT